MERIISLDPETVSQNGPIYPKGCNGILFRNVGDVDALLMGNIPLPAGEKNDDFFYNYPGDILQNQFDLSFQNPTVGTNPLVMVVRKFSRVPVVDQSKCPPNKK